MGVTLKTVQNSSATLGLPPMPKGDIFHQLLLLEVTTCAAYKINPLNFSESIRFFFGTVQVIIHVLKILEYTALKIRISSWPLIPVGRGSIPKRSAWLKSGSRHSRYGPSSKASRSIERLKQIRPKWPKSIEKRRGPRVRNPNGLQPSYWSLQYTYSIL